MRSRMTPTHLPPRSEYPHSDDMKKALIISLLIAVLAMAVEFIAIGKIRAEKERYKANQTALLADVERYKTESGKNAASVQRLTLTNAELRKSYEEICKTSEDLKIKVKSLQSVSNTATETKVEVKVPIRDTVVVRDEVIDRLSTFCWQDPWVMVSGEIERDSVALDICSTDTLVQLVHRVPHRFLFFKWGCKAIRQDIVSKNPHTNIVYTEYIELK